MAAGDLYRIPLWIVGRPLYARAPISVLAGLATVKGSILSVISRGRSQTLEQLEKGLAGAVPDQRERRRIVRRHFQFLERERFATLWPCVRGFTGGEAISIEGREHLDAALSGGRGALLVSAHFGYARLIKPVLRLHGYDVLLIGRRLGRMGRLSKAGRVARDLLGLPWAEASDRRWMKAVGYDLGVSINIRQHLAALARNQVLVTLADGRGSPNRRSFPVLGFSVDLSPNIASMAAHSGAPLLPIFVVDDRRSRDPLGVRVVIHPPLALPTAPDGRLDVDSVLGSIAGLLESHLRAAPHLWLRWSGPPPRWWGRSHADQWRARP